MEMPKYVGLLFLIYALGVLATLKLGCGVGYNLNTRCIESEKQALLQLKKTLIDNSNYLSSWVGDDCCEWHGIVCNNITNHVTRLELLNGYLGGKILPSLLELKYLAYLDLSNNSFDGIHIPNFFGSFEDLTYLNLSYSNFNGLVPHHLGNLSSLQYLDLSNYVYVRGFELSMYSMNWLSKLSLLKHLDLSGVNLSSAIDWFPAINMLPNSISVLDLSYCHLPNNIPQFPFINITSLVSLDLYDNQLNFSFPLWVLNNSNLAHLNLGSNTFTGPIPKSIGSLSALSYLDLSSNDFQGLIPQSISNLTSLSTLDLFGNKLSGSILREISNLTELTYLDIMSNNLTGCLPPTFCLLSKLERLFINYNQLSGDIPKCIGELSNLKALFLHGNSWKGFVSEHHFVNLTRLASFSISSESKLESNISPQWVPPFQLRELYIHSIEVGPKFPHWLLTQTHLRHLEMSNTSISDTIPVDWFLSLFLSPFSLVDLSNNDINGEQLSLISGAPNGLTALLLSNNRLSGEFPPFLCNQTSLTSLDLSNNNFSGELPRCVGNLTQLVLLNVMNNSLYGNIPSLGSLRSLSVLNLHNNNFQGKLPLSFQNLTKLFALDVGKNNLSDVLPPWTGEQLPHLKYLVLRSNNFYGKIPKQFCQHSSIAVLNLAHNQITGEIPSCFNNFSAMVTSNITPNNLGTLLGDVKMIDDTKGYEQYYTSTLQFLFSIDLSDNNISGEIPEELMDLPGLLNLNLASNHLTGRIPGGIGKLRNLIFLDLSKNELYGRIPQSLSYLNFLSQLNLSFNDLSGRIPTGNQLQTLVDPSIYVGNDQLCGQPILKPCTTDTVSQNGNHYNEVNSDFDSDDERMWIYAGIGPGLVVGFLGFCTSLYFIKCWRHSYFYFVEQVLDKIAVAIALLQRKFHD